MKLSHLFVLAIVALLPMAANAQLWPVPCGASSYELFIDILGDEDNDEFKIHVKDVLADEYIVDGGDEEEGEAAWVYPNNHVTGRNYDFEDCNWVAEWTGIGHDDIVQLEQNVLYLIEIVENDVTKFSFLYAECEINYTTGDPEFPASMNFYCNTRLEMAVGDDLWVIYDPVTEDAEFHIDGDLKGVDRFSISDNAIFPHDVDVVRHYSQSLDIC